MSDLDEKDANLAPATRRVVLGFQDAEDMDVPDLPTEPLPLNMGPSHPAMHGTVRMVLEVEGEKISSADIQIGYLHRCFEKEAESRDLDADLPVHGSPQLHLADVEQHRLRDGGREAAGHQRRRCPSAPSTSA